ncbi:hypothetical protein HON52_03110 [Candidatus Uhrbacteria bacterium]|jgi:hypothetical protein|nr:hypothetical protein [Candidatus Uhrbacteria bacterium]
MYLSPRSKFLLILVGFIGTVILIGWLIVALLFRGSPVIEEEIEDDTTQDEDGRLSLADEIEQRESQDEDSATGQLPSSVADGGETFTQRLTSSAITEPTIIGDTILFYDPRDGLFYMIDSSGELIAITDQSFAGAETVTIANSGTKAALEFPDGSNIIYDLESGEQTTLPSHWEEFEFSEDGEEVANKSLTVDSNSNALIVSSSEGSQTQVVAGLGKNEAKVTVSVSPNNNVVAFSETGETQSGFGRAQIYLIDYNGEAMGSLIVEGGNFSAIWSPSGNDILYSVSLASAGDTPSLWYTNATGSVGSDRERIDLNTWVEKCTFKDEATIICAAPREVTAGSGLDHRLIDGTDDVYEVTLATGRVKLLASPVLDIQMENLSVSDDESILYFTDSLGRLNFMRLK